MKYIYYGSNAGYMSCIKNEINSSGNLYIDNIKEDKVRGRMFWIQYELRKHLYYSHSILYCKNKFNKAYKEIEHFVFDSQEEPICFIFTMAWADYILAGYVEFIKHKLNNAKFVLYLFDISRHYKQSLDVDYFHVIFDKIITFDFLDHNKYGFELYQYGFYERFHVDGENDINESDVYFCGKAKDRLDEIIKIHEMLTKEKLKCDFYLVDVPTNLRRYEDQIHYIDGMSYEDNVRHIRKTKCLLEIIQQGGSGYTLRTLEAIAYEKKLLTNNLFIQFADFYLETTFIKYFDINQSTNFAPFIYNEGRVDFSKYQSRIHINVFLEYLKGILTE